MMKENGEEMNTLKMKMHAASWFGGIEGLSCTTQSITVSVWYARCNMGSNFLSSLACEDHCTQFTAPPTPIKAVSSHLLEFLWVSPSPDSPYCFGPTESRGKSYLPHY